MVERASGRTSEPRWKAWFLVATATFFGTAIVGSVVLSWLGVD